VLRAVWKSLLARKVRLLMSTFAISLGVAFVVGSLVFSAALSNGFNRLFGASVGDVVVRPAGSTTMMFRTLTAIVMLAISGPALAQEAPRAQQPTDFKGVQLKNKAPVSNDVLQVKFRRPAESTLKNGMQLMLLEEHRSPTIQVEIAVPASSLTDPEGVPLSGATTALMRLGTKTHDAKTIAETLATLGASVNFAIGDRRVQVLNLIF